MKSSKLRHVHLYTLRLKHIKYIIVFDFIYPIQWAFVSAVHKVIIFLVCAVLTVKSQKNFFEIPFLAHNLILNINYIFRPNVGKTALRGKLKKNNYYSGSKPFVMDNGFYLMVSFVCFFVCRIHHFVVIFKTFRFAQRLNNPWIPNQLFSLLSKSGWHNFTSE